MNKPESLRVAKRQWLVRRGEPTIRRENRIKDVAELRRLLQSAVELEHSTIPPYLCALYSLQEGANREAAQLIKSVVMEEMLHLILAANVLNAIGPARGGSEYGPQINHARFIPEYPTQLPVISAPFSVSLERFSPHAIDIFRQIERPVAVTGQPERTASGAPVYHSIGQFYEAIELALRDLSLTQDLFTGDPARQVTPEHYYGGGGRVVPVQDLASALEALREIVGQGEGVHQSVWDGDDAFGEVNELAHFFRFDEIARERRYTAADTASSGPSGAPLPVQWDAVRPMRANPKLADHAAGSELWRKTMDFNLGYMSLLDQLHAALNGQPRRLVESVGVMYELKYMAIALMNLPLGDGPETAGPSFEFVPAQGR